MLVFWLLYPLLTFLLLIVLGFRVRFQARPQSQAIGLVRSCSVHNTPLPSVPLWYNMPEEKLLLVLTDWMTRVQPLMSSRQADELRQALQRATDDLSADAAFADLPSVWPLALQSLCFAAKDRGHLYAYLPPAPRGMLLCLHGHGGNFRLTFHVWCQLARSLGLAVVAPSFGHGDWGSSGGTQAIEAARSWGLAALGRADLPVWLAGYSNGGVGVSRAAVEQGHHYAGLIYVAATFEPNVLLDHRMALHWHERPALVIQGTQDWNVRPASAQRGVDMLRRQGLRVGYQCLEADHFLLFTRQEAIARMIRDWLSW